jgi:hypothetical protein
MGDILEGEVGNVVDNKAAIEEHVIFNKSFFLVHPFGER